MIDGIDRSTQSKGKLMAAIDTILKSRLSTPALNRWCKGFTNVLNFAKAKNVPLVGIWSNGE